MAGCPIAAAPCHQGPQQHRRVQPVGLGTPGQAVHLQATRIHHPAGVPPSTEATVQPEPVIAGLVAKDDLHLPAARLLLTGPQATQQTKEAGDVAGLHPMRRILAARRTLYGEQPSRLTEFHRNKHSSPVPGRLSLCDLTHRPTPFQTNQSHRMAPVTGQLHGIFGHLRGLRRRSE